MPAVALATVPVGSVPLRHACLYPAETVDCSGHDKCAKSKLRVSVSE